MNKPLDITIHVLSPVHIGCDEVYEPTGFVIDENKKKLIEFEPFNFIEALTPKQKEEFITLCMKGLLLEIYKFVKRIYRPEVGGREISIAEGLVEHYRKVLNLTTINNFVVFNQFTLNRTAFSAQTKRAYIPGSSLKGSIRTAYLNSLAKQKRVGPFQYRGGHKDLEKALLGGSFDKDPFKMVKISDAIAKETPSTKIVYCINKKKKPGPREARGPFQITEIIKVGTTFPGILDVQQPLRGAGIERAITKKELLKSLNDFYMPLIEEEQRIYTSISANHIAYKAISQKFKENIGKSVFLIRLGQHSGAEAVTVEGHRSIRIMLGQGKGSRNEKEAMTVWCASESPKPDSNGSLTPFGWAAIEVLNPEDIEK